MIEPYWVTISIITTREPIPCQKWRSARKWKWRSSSVIVKCHEGIRPCRKWRSTPQFLPKTEVEVEASGDDRLSDEVIGLRPWGVKNIGEAIELLGFQNKKASNHVLFCLAFYISFLIFFKKRAGSSHLSQDPSSIAIIGGFYFFQFIFQIDKDGIPYPLNKMLNAWLITFAINSYIFSIWIYSI